MSFFRTKERQRDPKLDEGARAQRRQQLQAQQQMLDDAAGQAGEGDSPHRRTGRALV